MTHRELQRWDRAYGLGAEKVWVGLSWSFAFAIATYTMLSVASVASADDIVAHSFDVDASSLLKGEALQIDLGNVRYGSAVELSLKITNDQSTTFSMLARGASCGCTSVAPRKLHIEPGKTASVKASVENERPDGRQSIITLGVIVNRKDEIGLARRVGLRYTSRTDYSLIPKDEVLKFAKGIDDSISTEIEIRSFFGEPLEGLKLRCNSDVCELTQQASPSGDSLVYIAKFHDLGDIRLTQIVRFWLTRSESSPSEVLARTEIFIRGSRFATAYPDTLKSDGERLTVVLVKPVSEDLSLSLRSESGESINADMRVIGKRIICFDDIVISPDCDAIDVINDATGVSLIRVVVDRNSTPTDKENSK